MAKTDDIHRMVMARAARPAPLARAPAAAGTLPYVAEAGQRLAEGLRSENIRLKSERADGMVILRLDPKAITHTSFANRLGESLSAADEEFIALKESIRRNGLLEPIRVRPAPESSAHSYEIVYGHRRHAACLMLDAEIENGFSVLALLDASAVDPHRLTQLMHAENDARQPLSPFEYGLMYRSWLAADLFNTQEALATAIGRDQSTVSSYIRVAELPEEVLSAFEDRRKISLRWLQYLSKALNADRAAVIDKAVNLAAQDPRSTEPQVFRELSALPAQSKRGATAREETVKVGGRVGCRIIRKERVITVRFPKPIERGFQAELAEQIRSLVEGYFRDKAKGKK